MRIRTIKDVPLSAGAGVVREAGTLTIPEGEELEANPVGDGVFQVYYSGQTGFLDPSQFDEVVDESSEEFGV